MSLLIFIGLCIFGFQRISKEAMRLLNRFRQREAKPLTVSQIVKKTEANYGQAINELALKFKLPATYLKALIVLEVGGRKPAPTRFEKGVFEKLQKLKKGELKKYEVLKEATLKDASDAAIKNLATSWGAFQIMGYKCVQMGIKVGDIRGEKSLYWGVKWIDEEYGYLLRKKRFKDAFHLHNTGQKYPKNGKPRTYHANYVPNGLKYIEMFEQLS